MNRKHSSSDRLSANGWQAYFLPSVRMRFEIVAVLLTSATGVAMAHDGPSEVLRQLDRTIAREGASSLLLYQRATEYRVLGRWDEANRDLSQAVQLDPAFIPARTEWARILMQLNQPAAARDVLMEGLKSSSDHEPAGLLRRICAEAYAQSGQWEEAVTEMAKAMKVSSQDTDAYLLQGRWLTKLGRTEKAARTLAQGYQQTGSFVLRVQWIESLIDAKRFSQALTEIEPELTASRWRSAWLIRRARALQGLSEPDKARVDLQTAIAEINRRLNPDHPDLSLLADRGLAQALLGHPQEAGADLQRAKDLGATSWMLERAWRVLDTLE